MLRKALRGDAMATNPAPEAPVGPSAPNLTVKNLGQQFWADAYGKEVQTAATYSYTWLADQFGHIAIGIVTDFLATMAAGWVIVLISFLATGWPLISFVATLIAGLVIALISLLAPLAAGGWIALIGVLVPLAAGGLIAWISGADLSQIWAAGLEAPSTSLLAMLSGLVIAAIGASLWELSAYRSSVKNATGTFPLDTKLLRDNAVIATFYIVLGAVLGFAFHLHAIPAWPVWIPIPPWLMSWLILSGVVILAIWLAPRWLRQKITWQKAALPYLFRLADAAPTIGVEDAKALQSLIEGGAPPGAKPPCQIVIGGPIGSGRTPMAAGIGTEFAFKNNKVRYLSLDMLLEFAACCAAGRPYPDDPGPTTIMYWPWSEAQVVIIDDVGPLIAAQEPQQKANLARFTKLLNNELKSIAGVLAQCHTVWVIGDLRPPYESGTLTATLNDFTKAIRKYCSSQREALVIELGEALKPFSLMGAPQAAAVSNVRWIGPNKNP
jgi:hypothetical protein